MQVEAPFPSHTNPNPIGQTAEMILRSHYDVSEQGAANMIAGLLG